MRHKKKGKKFNRTNSHRKMMFRNMCTSLFKYESIKTTLQKAKELKRFVEPLINIAKINNVKNRRIIFTTIKEKKIVKKLFENIAPKFKNNSGGYLKIFKYGFRKGDNAKMAIIKMK